MKKGIGPQNLGAPKPLPPLAGGKMLKSAAKQTKNSYEKSRKKDNERIARNTAGSELEEYENNPSTRRAASNMSNEQRRRILKLTEERVIAERETRQMQRARKAKK
jgi:hypothetical protein